MVTERLSVVLELITGSYKREAKEAATATGQIGDSAQTTSSTLKTMAGAAVIGAAVAGLTRMAKAAGENADRLFDLQSQTGANLEQLQEYEFVAKAAGASQEFFSDAVKAVIKNLNDAEGATGAAGKAYETLGINVLDANGNLRDAGTITEETISKLAGMENITQRNALAQDIFGKKWEETVSVLDMGSDAIERLKGEAHDVGAVLSTGTLVAADRLRESVAKLEASLSGKLMEGLGLLALGLGRAFGDEASTDALNMVEALKSIVRWIDEGDDPLLAFTNGLFHAAAGGKVLTEELTQLASAAGFALEEMSADELRAFALLLEEQARAAGLDEIAIARAGSAFRVMAADMDAAGVGLGIYREQAKGAATATDELASALAAADDAELSMLRANQQAAEAQARFIELQQSGTATVDELRVAQLELNIAVREAKLANDVYSQSLDGLDGRTVTVTVRQISDQANAIASLGGGRLEEFEFARGGIVPGPRGARVRAVVHGGETILPTHDVRIPQGGGSMMPYGMMMQAPVIHRTAHITIPSTGHPQLDAQMATITATVVNMVEVQN